MGGRPNARALSRLGPRGTFGLALIAAAEEDSCVVGLSADLAVTAGMDRFRISFPDRFLNLGIAEQNLVGVASGLADDGWVPFAVSFANFSALRACEFVRHHLGYMRQNVKLVGIGAGFAMGQFGTTHYSLEDVSALRAIPNMTIVAPADCSEVFDAVAAAAAFAGPIYLRLNGAPSMPAVDQGVSRFSIGEARVLSVGSDVTFIAAGSMVARASAAAEILLAEGVSVGVINMHTIKPLDSEAVLAAARGSGLIVTVEEHSVLGGLGASVSEILAEYQTHPRLVRIGVEDTFPKVGSYEFVLEQCGLTARAIADRSLSALRDEQPRLQELQISRRTA
jgi:transketolase